MSLTITNDTVQSAFYGTDSLTAIKYGRTKVWPNVFYDSPYIFFDAPEKTRVVIIGKKDELRFSEDGENFHKPAGDNPTAWFGGDLGPFWVFGVGDGVLRFQNSPSDLPFIVGGSLASARGESDSYAGKSYAYYFEGCKVSDASMLRFPESYGGVFSAVSMFEDCSNLTKGPELPSTGLTEDCYKAMFKNCVSLEEMPELKATYIPKNAYQLMFYGCTALKRTNTILAKNVSNHGMAQMFERSGIELADDLVITTVADSGCLQMFNRCNSLETAPHFDLVQAVDDNSFDLCFGSCENLRTAICRIPLNKSWVGRFIFSDCTNLSYVEIGKPGTDTAENCLGGAFVGCPSLSTVHFNAVTPPYVGGVSQWSNAWGAYLFMQHSSLTFYYPSSVVNRTQLLQSLAPYPNTITSIAE